MRQLNTKKQQINSLIFDRYDQKYGWMRECGRRPWRPKTESKPNYMNQNIYNSPFFFPIRNLFRCVWMMMINT